MAKKDPENKTFSKSFYIFTLVGTFILGILFSALVVFFSNRQSNSVQNASLSMSDVHQIYDILLTEHYQDPNSETLIQGAMDGMANAVEDPYTDYLMGASQNALSDDITGSFEGIGAEIIKDGGVIRVVSPLVDSPAEEAGIQPNDAIISIDGQDVAELTASEAAALIRGPEGTTVELEIVRDNQSFNLTIERQSIPIETVRYELDSENSQVGYLRITNFSLTTTQEFKDAVEDLRNQGAEEFIIDVRGNPGGVLQTALELSSMFLPDGEPLMYVQEDENAEPVEFVADSEEYGNFKIDEDVVLLINEGSASASEILAGALQNQGVPLVGSQTFGKGTVQNVIPLGESGDLKYTHAIWLTAGGEWINEQGIEPDYEVENLGYNELLLIDTSQVYAPGQVAPEVSNINNILRALGYEQVPDSEEFTEETEQAVSAFQQDQGLEETGLVDQETGFALMQALREQMEDQDPAYNQALQVLADA